MSSFFTSILTAAYLVHGITAGKVWDDTNGKGLYGGGWYQNPADTVTVIVTRTQTVCPCDATGVNGPSTNVFTRSTSTSTSSSSYIEFTSLSTSTSSLPTYTTVSSSSSTTQSTSPYYTNGTSSATSGPDSSSSVILGSTTLTGTTSIVLQSTSSSNNTSSNTSSTVSNNTASTTSSVSSSTITSSSGTISGTASGTTTGITSGTTSGVTSGTTSRVTSVISSATFSNTTSIITTTVANSTASTTSSGAPVATFNFLAFGNPYVVDGTSLGDYFVVSSDRPNRGYANLNNGSTGFYVDSTNALTDSQTGSKVVVIGGLNPAPVRFFTQSYINDPSNPDSGNIFTCNCSLDASQNLSCDCNGLTVFAADYRGYLYVQSASPTKRDILHARQATSSSASATSGTATVALSATPAATGTNATTTTTTCSAPLQTFNLVSNGSVVTNGSASNVQPVPDGKYVKQTDWNATEHYQYCGFRNGSFSDPDPGFFGGNFTWDPCTGIVTEITYGRLLTTAPSSSFSEAYFMPLDIIISAGGDLCYCNIDQTTYAFTCTCGPNSIFQNPPSWQLYIGSYARVGGGIVYPIAEVYG